MNGVTSFLSKTALTSVMSMMLASAMLPKGMKITDLPKLISYTKKLRGNANAQNILDVMENEEQLSQALKGLNPADLVDNKTIATTTNKETVVIDQRELDSLEDMSISKELKDQIRQNYAQVGSIPGAKIERAGDPAVHSPEDKSDAKGDSADRGPASIESSVSKQMEPPKSYADSLGKLHATLTKVEHKPAN
jgi:hypothetical protein